MTQQDTDEEMVLTALAPAEVFGAYSAAAASLGVARERGGGRAHETM